MKVQTANLKFFLISLAIQPAAFGESATKILRPRTAVQQQQPVVVPLKTPVLNTQKPIRRVANVNEKSYGKIRTRRGSNQLNPDRDTDIRLSLVAGLSNMGSGDASVQGFRDEQKLGMNYLAGIGADVRLDHYYGAELDAYYGIAPTQTIVFDDEETQKKKLQHLGGMLNLKGQYPTYLGDMRFVPKIGIGYGMLSLKQSTESQLLSETYEANESIKGVYGTIGFDIEPISWMIFTADYARSVTASGNFSVKSNTVNSETALTEAQFDRIRVGLLFRVYPNVLVGGNYTRRTLKFGGEDNSANVAGDASSLIDISSSEALSQIAGTIMFQF